MNKQAYFEEHSASRIERIYTFFADFSFFGLSLFGKSRKQSAKLDTDIGSDNNRPDSGGYNEAFIVQHWTSYGPRY